MNTANILKATEEVFDQISTVIDSLSNKQYAQPLPIIGDSTIGQHLRHAVDFYLCISEGAQRANVLYDKRERQIELEYDRKLMIDTLKKVLDQIAPLDMDGALRVTSEIGYSTELEYVSESTLGRELLYAYEHAIHHLALVRIGIAQNFPDVELPEELGIAPSTVRHRKSVNQS